MNVNICEEKVLKADRHDIVDVELKEDKFTVLNGEQLPALQAIRSEFDNITEAATASVADKVVASVLEVETKIQTAVDEMHDDIIPAIQLLNVKVDDQKTELQEDLQTFKEETSTSQTTITNSITEQNTTLLKEISDSETRLTTNIASAVRTDEDITILANQSIATALEDNTLASVEYVQSYVAENDQTLSDTQVKALADESIQAAMDEDGLIASSTKLTNLETLIGENSSGLSTLSQTVADETEALTKKIDTLSSDVDGTITTINTELMTLATDDLSLAEDIKTLTSSVDDNSADIITTNKTISDNDTTYAGQFTTLTSAVNDAQVDATAAQSSLDTFKEVYSTDQETLAQYILSLESSIPSPRTDGEISAIANQELTTAVTDGTLASTQYVQDYMSTNDKTRTNTEITALAKDAITTAIDEEGLLASSKEMTDLTSIVDGHTSDLSTVNQTISNNDSAYTQQFENMSSKIEDLDGENGRLATIESNQETYATEKSALASDVSELSATVDGQSATITELSQAVVDVNGNIDAIKQVGVDVDGNITGWTATNGTSGSSFLIQADKFAITDQTRSAQPFSIDATTGDIQFNGKVTFGNTNITPELEASLQGSDGTDGINGIDGYTPVKGVDYFDGIDGADGSDGDSAYTTWIAEGNSGSTTDFINSLIGKDGVDGTDGIPGINGQDGTTTYTWIKYADSADGHTGFSNSPVDKAYMGLSFNRDTATESTNPDDYTWSLIKGSDGIDGYSPVKGKDYFDGEDGLDGSDGDSAYNVWLSENNSGTTTDFLNSLIGKDGINGTDGIPGKNGVDGSTTYTWIKYADSSDGSSGFSNTSTSKSYIGFAFNKTTSEESTNPNDYTWSLIKGSDGQDGVNGQDGSDGADGKSAYQSAVDNGFSGTETEWVAQQVTHDEVAEAIANDTTVIDGSRIITGTIDADRINTNGLVAENINASSVIKGNRIEGAVINGSVIRASYLDLDGDLEVLTDYHITADMYNENPDLYTDAIYISANNEYRIPTVSSVEEPGGGIEHQNLEAMYNDTYGVYFYFSWSAIGTIYTTHLKNYLDGNSGHNVKIRKSSPKLDTRTCTNLLLINMTVNRYNTTHCSQYTAWGKSKLYFNDEEIAELYIKENATCNGTMSANYSIIGPSVNYSGGITTSSGSTPSVVNGTFTYKGVTFRWSASVLSPYPSIQVSLESGLYQVEGDLDCPSGNLFKMEIVNRGGYQHAANVVFSFQNPAGLSVNNMIG